MVTESLVTLQGQQSTLQQAGKRVRVRFAATDGKHLNLEARDISRPLTRRAQIAMS